jgi:hypothetical protein
MPLSFSSYYIEQDIGVSPNHGSSQKHILKTSPTTKEARWKKSFLTRMIHFQKIESVVLSILARVSFLKWGSPSRCIKIMHQPYFILIIQHKPAKSLTSILQNWSHQTKVSKNHQTSTKLEK